MRCRQKKTVVKPLARIAIIFDAADKQVRVHTNARAIADIELTISAQIAYYKAHNIPARLAGVEIEDGAAPRGFKKFAAGLVA